MTAAAPALQGIDSEPRKLSSYTNLFPEKPEPIEVFLPKTVDQVVALFAYAKAEGLTVTLRGGGHSFDRQSLGRQVVISMERFTCVEVLPEDEIGPYRWVRVGAGTTWGAILRELQPLGLAPAVTVTTEHATAGGTLSGDCLSRFSTAWGKEGEWIERFELVTPDGAVLDCSPAPAGTEPDDWSPAQRVFAAAIGGLGYIGAVTRIVYRVLKVPHANGEIGVSTEISKHKTSVEFGRALVDATRRTYGEQSDPAQPQKHDAVYAAMSPKKCGTREALMLRSAFAPAGATGARMLLFVPTLKVRVLLECLLRWVWFNRLFWWAIYTFGYRRAESYVNKLAGYTFFMDGNVRAKHAARRLGFRLKGIQQTFIVPLRTTSEDAWDDCGKELVRWLEHAYMVLDAKNLTPSLHDVLFLPPDLPFRLSATADMGGFAVSYAFETSRRRKLRRAREAFTQLADDLWTQFGGRVYLVKNVCASQETLRAMYGDNLARFFEVKRDVDPHCILRNEFLEDLFGDLLQAEPIRDGDVKREDAYTRNIAKGLDAAYERSARDVRRVDLATDRLVILSDQHRGARDGADDFRRCEPAYNAALAYYYREDYDLYVLGDVDELWECTPKEILATYPETLRLERQFLEEHRYVRFFGNHDDLWQSERAVRRILWRVLDGVKVREALRIDVTRHGQPLGHLFLVHGHQGTPDYRWRFFARPIVRWLWRPLQRKLKFASTSPALDWDLRDRHDNAMFQWAKGHPDHIVLVAGHTHRPVFWNKVPTGDYWPRIAELRHLIAAEQDRSQRALLEAELAYLLGEEHRRVRLTRSFPVPCYFNTGCCSFGDGDITGIEICDGDIRLVHWPDRADVPRPLVLQSKALAEVFDAVGAVKTGAGSRTVNPRPAS
jgi:decaprenylphospho-beta-D-ribofuranose 2-oxidase